MQKEMLLESYVEDIGDIPLHVFLAAVKYCRKNCKWFPKVTEILEAADNQRFLWMYGRDRDAKPEGKVPDEVNPVMQKKIMSLISGVVNKR